MKHWRRLLGKIPASFVLGKAGLSANICSVINITSVDPISHAQGIIVIFFWDFWVLATFRSAWDDGWPEKMKNSYVHIMLGNSIRTFPCLCIHEATMDLLG